MLKSEKTTITCTDPSLAGSRLDKYLFTQFPDYSRNYFQELIDQGLIVVNQAKTKSSYSIKLGDTIDITFTTKEYNVTPCYVPFEVIDEQPDFLVINKPAGLLVHPTATSGDAVSLVNGLLYRFKEIEQLEDELRPGIVHRLDKNTSGLMLVAKTRQGLNTLSAMFKKRTIHKTYLAVVSNTPPQAGSIDFPIGRHQTEHHKMAPGGINHRTALTHYTRLATYQDAALVAANIVTGRTHQIRVHFTAIGNPLIGDAIYGAPSPLIDRQALHSWKISFEYNGKTHEYRCPLPDDMKKLVRTLHSVKKPEI